jgi:hypothetical protein
MKKDYYIQHNIGKAKYVVSYHNGTDTHKDGSKFYNVKLFKNKKNLNNFIQELTKDGYREKGISI